MASVAPRSVISQSRASVGSFLERTAVKEALAEFFGTFILIAVGNASAAAYVLRGSGTPVDIFAVCFCWGIGAMIGISASAAVSGGHINPAVTVAFAVLRKFPWSKVWYYVLAQYLGAIAASAVVYTTYCEAIGAFDNGVRSAYGRNTSTGGIFATYPHAAVSIWGSFIDQVIGTAFLVYAVCAVCDPKKLNVPKWLQPIFLCFVITGLCIAYGLNCGAILNPARDLGPRIFTTIAGYGWEPFQPLGGHYWWVAGVVGPHIGAIAGGYLYNFSIDHDSFTPRDRVHSVATTDSLEPIKGELALRSVSTEEPTKDIQAQQTKEATKNSEDEVLKMRNC